MQYDVRAALIGAIDASFASAYPGKKIVYDNTAFDRNNAPDVWVEFEVKFGGGHQIGMSATPKTRVWGFLYVTVWTKDGAGWKQGDVIADWFATQLKYGSFGGVNLQAPEPVDEKGPTGWHLSAIKLYFYTGPQ